MQNATIADLCYRHVPEAAVVGSSVGDSDRAESSEFVLKVARNFSSSNMPGRRALPKGYRRGVALRPVHEPGERLRVPLQRLV